MIAFFDKMIKVAWTWSYARYRNLIARLRQLSLGAAGATLHRVIYFLLAMLSLLLVAGIDKATLAMLFSACYALLAIGSH